MTSQDTIHKQEHWDGSYSARPLEELGWYQENPFPSLTLIQELELPKNARQFHAGTGASTLVDHLLRAGYSNLVLNDISGKALNTLRQRLGSRSSELEWVEDDLLEPTKLHSIEAVQLWHDRAVFHFFTSHGEQESYIRMLDRILEPDGHLILGTFSLDGPEKCSGLPVQRYDIDSLTQRFSDAFEPIDVFEYLHKNPRGQDRPYVYGHFKKRGATENMDRS